MHLQKKLEKKCCSICKERSVNLRRSESIGMNSSSFPTTTRTTTPSRSDLQSWRKRPKHNKRSEPQLSNSKKTSRKSIKSSAPWLSITTLSKTHSLTPVTKTWLSTLRNKKNLWLKISKTKPTTSSGNSDNLTRKTPNKSSKCRCKSPTYVFQSSKNRTKFET